MKRPLRLEDFLLTGPCLQAPSGIRMGKRRVTHCGPCWANVDVGRCLRDELLQHLRQKAARSTNGEKEC